MLRQVELTLTPIVLVILCHLPLHQTLPRLLRIIHQHSSKCIPVFPSTNINLYTSVELCFMISKDTICGITSHRPPRSAQTTAPNQSLDYPIEHHEVHIPSRIHLAPCVKIRSRSRWSRSMKVRHTKLDNALTNC
jgi:hypothetical protein